MADRLLQRLRIDLVDLLAPISEGIHRVPPGGEAAHPGECRMVALLDGWIGPEYPFPHTGRRSDIRSRRRTWVSWIPP